MEPPGVGHKDIVSANRNAFRLIANLNVAVHLLRGEVDAIQGTQAVFPAIIGTCIGSYVSVGTVKSDFARTGYLETGNMFFILGVDYLHQVGLVYGDPGGIEIELEIVGNGAQAAGNDRVHLAESVADVFPVRETEEVQGSFIFVEIPFIQDEEFVERLQTLFTYCNYLTRKNIVLGGDDNRIGPVVLEASRHCQRKDAADNQQCIFSHIFNFCGHKDTLIFQKSYCRDNRKCRPGIG